MNFLDNVLLLFSFFQTQTIERKTFFTLSLGIVQTLSLKFEMLLTNYCSLKQQSTESLRLNLVNLNFFQYDIQNRIENKYSKLIRIGQICKEANQILMYGLKQLIFCTISLKNCLIKGK
jgi:hypothetical protein